MTNPFLSDLITDFKSFNPISSNTTKWSNTLKQVTLFVQIVGLALKGLNFRKYSP